MKFFITGVGGQLGHDVMNELLKRGHEGVGSDIQETYSGVADGSAVTKAPYVALDITDKDAVEKVITEVNPDAVIHCAAWTAVDMAEDDDTVFDVAVDLRSDSKSYGKWYGVTLSAENKKQFLIPEGFAHGFLVLSDEAEFCYKVNDFWHPNDEGGMAWNDPEIGIEWPELKGEYKGSASAEGYTLEDGTALNLSDKDQKWLGLKDTFKF